MSADVRVRLLGPIEVVADGLRRPVAGLRKRAVLAALGLQVRQVVSADDLIDVVWNGAGPVTALNALQSHVSSLRRAPGLREAILARAPGYVLDLGGGCTDVEVMEGLLRRAAEEADPARRAGLLRSALGRWRGPALAGLADLTWFADQATRLEGVRRGALSSLTEARLALGEHGALVGELEHLAERYPFDEELHRQLMLALYRCGRPSDALAAFGRLRRRLADELGVDPGPVLRGLQSSILRHDEALTLTGTTEPGGAGRVVLPAAREGALVERAAEMGLVEQALAEARAGIGSVVLFEGPAGIGKSALLGHARARARELGFNLAAAVGRQLETTYDWGCARQLFEGSLAAPLSFSGPAETPAPGSRSALPTPPGSQPGPDLERSEIHAFYRLVVRSCERGPLLVTLDDLQWCDLPSARMMAYLAVRAHDLPVVLLGASRPGVAEIDQVLAGLARFTRVLAPLSVNGCAALLGHVGEELAQQCHELTGGSPLLIREIGRHLGGESGLERGATGVRRLVQAQVRQLPPGAAGVAQALAVWPGPAGAEAVASTVRIDVAEALHHLAALRANQLVVASDGGRRFAPARPLIREAVYEGVGPGVRAGLHVRAAGVALRVGDVVGAGSQLLRVPAGWGGGVDAVGVLGEAARVCLARGAVDSAVAFLRRLLEEDLGGGRGGVLTRLGMAEYLVDTGAAVGHLTAGLALETDPETRARTALALAGAQFFAGHAAQAVAVCREALADGSISMSARQGLESCMIDAAYPAHDALGLTQMIEAQREVPGDDSDGGLMRDAALSLWDACRNDRRSAQQRAARAVAGDVLIRHPLAESTLACAWQVLDVCDAPQALPSVDAAIAHARRSGSLRALAPAMCFRSALMLSRGHLAEAVSDGRAGWEAVTTSSIHVGLPYIGNYLALALLHRGDVTGARKVLADVRAGCPADISTRLFGEALIALALAEDDIPEAYRLVGALRDECDNLAIENPILADWRSPMIIILDALGRRRAAEDVSAQFVDVARTWGTPRAVARSLRLSATVAPARKRPELLSEAAELLDGTEARLEHAQTLHALGGALLRLGYADDAHDRLQQGHQLASECGAVPLRDALADRLHEGGARPRRGDVTGRRGLTPSEARVADLAAHGLTDKEIAQQLYLTTRKVELHLTSALRKLGVTTRTELPRVLTPQRP
ncbi:BTAD domain-containing putative transcriptional regulator [Micromonospora sp. RP3T]|uniref:BTAD domain-containing putative transcriptional regulator n=1 Tax=Micromonospora sp. RP3T TaxID=2135446 RepID=UPI000D15DD42|nr:BTAD domain-containing putative transcriptional regulator [Micromonospora sp. RP3T]PTA43239.1 hypothetical protein C8054_26630 [Micromonospora sp. RP3T]